jgi:prepilin-type processing-associated H-X9-DG protein
MKTGNQTSSGQAFTRLELLAALIALALLASVVLPALAGTRRGTDLAGCVNNLRQIGRAFQLWGNDHNDDWPCRVSMSEGGILMHPLLGNTWFHFSWMSNGLATPRVLACPSDFGKRPARDFGNSADGGFVNSGYRNNAVSYFVGSDASRFLPRSFLCGDRNVRIEGYAACSAGLNNAAYVTTRPPRLPFWTNNLHGLWGNILFYDGQVQSALDQNMPGLLPTADDAGSLHLVMP